MNGCKAKKILNFDWYDTFQLVCIKPHLQFKINDEGEGFKYIRFVEGGIETIYSRSYDHLVEKIEKEYGKTNLKDFKKEMMLRRLAMNV